MQNDRFDAIPIPKELDSAVKAGIQEGIRQQKYLKKKKSMLRYSLIAAAALIFICAGVFLVSNPSLAAKLPLIGHIFSRVQEKVSYKGDFDDNAEVYVEDHTTAQEADIEQSPKGSAQKQAGETQNSGYVQTSNGLTITVSEANCSPQALYLALCIENEEDFPADFIKTKNMDGYIPDYDSMYLKTISYYDVPGLEKKDRMPETGKLSPYFIEGEFIDSRTFTGIIRVSLDEDLMSSGHAVNLEEAQTDDDIIWVDKVEKLPKQFTYYLEISDIYAELLEYEEVQASDADGDEITIQEALEKHYEGTWNFAIDVNMNEEGKQVVTVNKTNSSGIGISSVEKTDFEIKAELILPEGAKNYDYVVVICDAEGKQLDSQGVNAEEYSVYGRKTDTVHIYVCDYIQYMDELKGDEQKIAEGALFAADVDF